MPAGYSQSPIGESISIAPAATIIINFGDCVDLLSLNLLIGP